MKVYIFISSTICHDMFCHCLSLFINCLYCTVLVSCFVAIFHPVNSSNILLYQRKFGKQTQYSVRISKNCCTIVNSISPGPGVSGSIFHIVNMHYLKILYSTTRHLAIIKNSAWLQKHDSRFRSSMECFRRILIFRYNCLTLY